MGKSDFMKFVASASWPGLEVRKTPAEWLRPAGTAPCRAEALSRLPLPTRPMYTFGTKGMERTGDSRLQAVIRLCHGHAGYGRDDGLYFNR